MVGVKDGVAVSVGVPVYVILPAGVSVGVVVSKVVELVGLVDGVPVAAAQLKFTSKGPEAEASESST